MLCHCREISSRTFQQFSISIANYDQLYTSNNKGGKSYSIKNNKDSLSKRESEIMFFLLRGKTMVQISEILFLSKRTVENHVANIKEKLNCNKKSQLIEYGMQQGYLNIIPESLLRKDISLILTTS